MGAAMFFSLGMLVFLSIPLITGSFARRMGRSFTKWFFISMILPVVATLLLFFLPDISEERA
jgi:hypothetical protein